MENNTNNLTKNEFINSINQNLGDTINTQAIIEEYTKIFDLIENLKLNISYIPLFRDQRYYEIKDNKNRIKGQIFCTNNTSSLYMLTENNELYINFENTTINEKSLTIKKIKYNSLNLIDTNDEYLMENLDRLDNDLKPMFHLEINDKKYYADTVVETEEWIENNKYVETKAKLYDYDFDMYDCDYKSFEAGPWYKDKTQLVFHSASSLDGFAVARKVGDSIPPIRIYTIPNKTPLKFNFEKFVDFHLSSGELDTSNFEYYKINEYFNGEKISDNVHSEVDADIYSETE